MPTTTPPLAWTHRLHPDLVTRIHQVLQQMGAAGHPMKVCQGIRTAEAQYDLWLQGRHADHPGRIVTNCDGYTLRSRHQVAAGGYGHAVDCCFLGPHPFSEIHPWGTYGAAVRAAGLIWGGDFKSLPQDRPHAELPIPMSSGPVLA